MYRLKEFFDSQVGSPPTIGTYASNVFDPWLFDLNESSSDAVAFFGWGRYVTYGTHGYKWAATAPKLMPYDNYNPTAGYLEQISSSGVAQGWTCDWDLVTGRIQVDFYDPYGNKVASGWANSGSEAAINTECHGGTAHRFWVQLPSSSRGMSIRAYGLDYTWFGFTQLPCLQSPSCSW
jgi:hypothetical protein